MKVRRFAPIAGLIVVLLAAGLLLAACDGDDGPETEPSPTPAPGATDTPAPAIDIDSPQGGDTITSPVTVSGTASVFEATLNVAIKDAAGNVLCETFTTASEGAPGRGDYEVTLAFVPPESAEDGSVEAYTRSAKDGSIQDRVSLDVTLSEELPAIVVTSPQCNQEVRSPLVVEGTASVFEAALVVVVRDAQGLPFAHWSAQAAEGAPARGEFTQEVTFSIESRQQGTIEAYSASPRDGSIINLFSLPVILVP